MSDALIVFLIVAVRLLLPLLIPLFPLPTILSLLVLDAAEWALMRRPPKSIPAMSPRAMAAAIGLLQVLPVQRKRMFMSSCLSMYRASNAPSRATR